MGPSIENEPICPNCSKNDRVVHASALYFVGLEKKYPGRVHPIQDVDKPPNILISADLSSWDELSGNRLTTLADKLAPPSSSKRAPARPIHPDMIIGAFSLIAPVFIYGILTSQPGMLPYTLPLLAALYAFYLWQRRNLIVKYETQLEDQRRSEERQKRAIERWIWLRCCARCEMVFLPGKEAVDVERMNEVLTAVNR